VKEAGDHLGSALSSNGQSKRAAQIQNLSDTELQQMLQKHGRDCKSCPREELVHKVLRVLGKEVAGEPRSSGFTSISSLGSMILETGDHIQRVWAEKPDLEEMASAAWDGFASLPRGPKTEHYS